MATISPVMQISWVTKDLEGVEAALSAQYGVKKWFRNIGFETDPAITFYRGKPVRFLVDVSLAYSGDMQLEIIRPVSGDANPYDDFLSCSGPGLHHTCVEVDDITEALAGYAADGLDTIFRLDIPGFGAFAYVQGPDTGSSVLEVGQFTPELKANNEWMKAESR